MVATVVLGILIAAGFVYGLSKIYKAFFKGEAACCDSGGCGGACAGCAMHQAMDNSYRARVEKIEKFPLQRTIDVDGMTCDKCVARVVRELEKIDGVAVAAASVEKQSAQAGLTKNISDETLIDAIRRAGYKPGSVFA